MVIYLAFIIVVGVYQKRIYRCVPVIHNFDLKRADGSTAASRFFARDFPELFPWLMSRIGDLPEARKSRKSGELTISIA